MDIQALINEIKTDPLARGYSSMTDAQLFASLMTANRTRERTSLSGSQIYNATVPSEFQALTADQKQYVRDIWGLGDSIDVRTGTNVRTVYLAIFGAGTTTRTNLANLVNETISRAVEIGCGDLTLAYLTYIRSLNS